MTGGPEPQAAPIGADEFETWFSDHARVIHAYATRRLGPDAGEEACAQTFAEAWRNRHRFDPSRGSPRAWLFGIASNVVRRHHRLEQRRLHALRRIAPDQRSDEWAEVAGRHDARMVWPQVADALLELRTVDRDLLWMQAVGGLSYQEMAEVTGVPVGTVRSRLSRARALVQRRLTAAGTASNAAPDELAGR